MCLAGCVVTKLGEASFPFVTILMSGEFSDGIEIQVAGRKHCRREFSISSCGFKVVLKAVTSY